MTSYYGVPLNPSNYNNNLSSQNFISNNNYPSQNYTNSPNLNFQKNNPNSNINPSSRPFIVGRFGKNVIVSQDLRTFANSIKTAEWTNNQTYLLAKDIGVIPSFSTNNNNNNLPRFSSKLDNLYFSLSSNSNICNDLHNYSREINERKRKLQEEVQKEKAEFIRTNFPNDIGNTSMSMMLDNIKKNKLDFIKKDQILYNKVVQMMPYIKNK